MTTAQKSRQPRVPLLNATSAPEAEQPKPQAQLMAAILAVQAAMPKLERNADGQAGGRVYKYTSIDVVVDAVLPLLVEHELTWTTFPTTDEHGAPAIRYKLFHIPSAEFEEDVMPLMCAKPDPQGQGSALTYARRYALVAVLNLTTGEDDDGAAASAPPGGTSQQPTAKAAQPSERPCSAKQRDMLRKKAQAAGLSAGDFANLVLATADEPPRVWRTEEHADQTLARLLDRLPARLVDAVIAGINGGAA